MTRSQSYWEAECEQATLQRNGRNGVPYTIHNEHRYVPSNVDRPRTGSRAGYHDAQEENDDANKQSQRRRIPVACGRCRKRKIRCSGPQGDTGCQNCKTAGNDNCQFNRVQSHPCEIMVDMPFSYSNLGHGPSRGIPLRAGTTQIYAAPNYSTSNGMMPYPMAFRPVDYSFSKPAFNGQYGDYPDDMNDYNNMPYPQPPIHDSIIDVGYRNANIPPPQRSFTPGPPLLSHKTQNMSFYESAGYSQPPNQSQHISSYPPPGQSIQLPLRSSISSQNNHFDFSDVAQSLSNPSTMNPERPLPVLPAPVSVARPATRYESGLYNVGTVPSNSSGLLPSSLSESAKSNTSAQLNSVYMGSTTSPDGTITSGSSFNSDTPNSSQADVYSSSGDWSNDSIQGTSPTHSTMPQQQHHLSSQTQTHMAPLPLTNRRSHPELQSSSDYDTYNQTSVTRNGNTSVNNPYTLNNTSLNSLHAMPTSTQDRLEPGSASGDTTPTQANLHARKLSHSHSLTHFAQHSADAHSGSLSSANVSASSLGGSGLHHAGSGLGGITIHGAAERNVTGSVLSNMQAYEPWDGTPSTASQTQQQHGNRDLVAQMGMGRFIGEERPYSRGSMSNGVRA